MKWTSFSVKTFGIFILATLFTVYCLAHNGKIAYAYPLGKITVDGDFSEWPKNTTRYFQVGYRLDNRSLYLAFTVTDEDFIEDTSDHVRHNTQDGIELCIDGRHLAFGSGVASFMLSKKLRNTNNAFFDSFAKATNWDSMEVKLSRKGNTRYYEWRISLNEQLVVGKSLGFDIQVFDKDKDGSFTHATWGKGDQKFRLSGSLGDIYLSPVTQQFGTIGGTIGWDRDLKSPLPGAVYATSAQNPKKWFAIEADSTGKFNARLPTGNYHITFPKKYIQSGDGLYSTGKRKPVSISVVSRKKAVVPRLTVVGEKVPHLLPVKGVMHDFNPATSKKIDHFIQSYQEYFDIPGISLALIKDGKVVYHKTYGVKNAITKEKLEEQTLFEAASITKPVFSFTVLRLAERGIIDLDKPLYLYLPYQDIAYDERYKLITAKHVLTHRTGFPNWRYMNEDGKLDLKFTPGTAYNYSGEGFEYLKMVVEKITGKKVEQVLKEEVIDPIGLYHTFFSKNDSLQRMVANGHYDLLPSPADLPESPGMAYSMHTEAKIFTKFMLYLLEQKGLKPATYDTMFSKQSEFTFDPGEPRPKVPSYMGVSLEIRETPFGKAFGHGGNNGDFTCHFEVYKDLKMGYAIFTNSNTSYPLLRIMREFLVEGKEKE